VDPEFIRDLFAPFRPVTVRRMFSGAGIFADGLMFGLIVDGAIHLKVDETNIADFEREGRRAYGLGGTRICRRGAQKTCASQANETEASAQRWEKVGMRMRGTRRHHRNCTRFATPQLLGGFARISSLGMNVCCPVISGVARRGIFLDLSILRSATDDLLTNWLHLRKSFTRLSRCWLV
jgi:TfoX/Sxy family transcriptional regulator of competence genes